MCSSLTRQLTTLALGAVVVLAIGCGHKDSPKPPPQRIPQPVRDLKVAQRGDRILLSFTYPQTTISGLPIDDIVAIELWEFEMPVPEFNPATIGEDEETPGDGSEVGDADPDGDAPMRGDSDPDAEAPIDSDGSAPGVTGVDEFQQPESEWESAIGADFAAEATLEIDLGASQDEPVQTETPIDLEVGAEEEGSAELESEDTSEETVTDPAQAAADSDDDDDDPDTTASKELLLELDPRQFEAGASKRIVLEGNDLSNAIHGDKVELELTLDEIEPGEKEALIYGVKSFQTLKRASSFSNLARIIPRVTPDPPAEVELTPESKGVQVGWTFEGHEPKEFRFYRRDPRSSAFGEHHGTQDGESDSYLDSRAELGQSYVYVMTAVINRTPLVESDFSSEQEIEYLDDFPPEPPSELVVFSDVGSARLLWERSDDDDLAGYVVYRRSAGIEYAPLFEQPIRQTEYNDTTASSGRTFLYRVVAVDETGNMSDPSLEVQVRIP